MANKQRVHWGVIFYVDGIRLTPPNTARATGELRWFCEQDNRAAQKSSNYV